MTTTIATIDPHILGGKAVFVGSRVPIGVLFENLVDGMSLDQILDAYPTIGRDLAVRALQMGQSALIESVDFQAAAFEEDTQNIKRSAVENQFVSPSSTISGCESVSCTEKTDGKRLAARTDLSNICSETGPIPELNFSSARARAADMKLDTTPKMIHLKVVLTDVEASALACLLSTVGWGQIRPHAEDDIQAFHMRSAIAALAVSLKAGGYTGGKNDTTSN